MTDQQKLFMRCGITEDHFSEIIWNTGNDYAIWYCGRPDMAIALTKTSSYWSWYKSQVQVALVKTLNLLTTSDSEDTCLEIFFLMLEPNRIAGYPNPVIIKQAIKINNTIKQ